MIGQYRVNGYDLFELAGFIADGGRVTSNSIERPRSPKPTYKYDFKDEQGVQWDFISPVFDEPRSLRLDGHIIATSEADYEAKKLALVTLLKSGLLTIYASHIEKTVSAKFKSFLTWERLTKIKGQTKIVTKIGIELDEIMDAVLPTYDLFYGSSAGFPLTQSAVQNLTNAAFSNVVELQTGTVNRVFSIVIQSDKNIVSVLSTPADAPNPIGLSTEITSQYTQRGTVIIGGVTYKIMSMQVGFPYSSNHKHTITLS